VERGVCSKVFMGEPIKRVIGVLERILGLEGSSGYDPERMIPPS